jgi:hypothetical protein
MQDQIKTEIAALYNDLDGNDVFVDGISTSDGIVAHTGCRLRHTHTVIEEYDAPDGWVMAISGDEQSWAIVNPDISSVPDAWDVV